MRDLALLKEVAEEHRRTKFAGPTYAALLARGKKKPLKRPRACQYSAKRRPALVRKYEARERRRLQAEQAAKEKGEAGAAKKAAQGDGELDLAI